MNYIASANRHSVKLFDVILTILLVYFTQEMLIARSSAFKTSRYVLLNNIKVQLWGYTCGRLPVELESESLEPYLRRNSQLKTKPLLYGDDRQRSEYDHRQSLASRDLSTTRKYCYKQSNKLHIFSSSPWNRTRRMTRSLNLRIQRGLSL